MISQPLDEITLASLEALKDSGAQEGSRLEYKRELPGGKHDEKIPFLAQVCAFANTEGGDLLLGIEEEKGLISAIPGFAVDDPDALKLRLEGWIREGLEPTLTSVNIKEISVEAGRFVVVVRVFQSWHRPHRVKKTGQFYGRTSAGKYQLDMPEIRRLFLRSEGQTDRIRSFHADRLIALANNRTPLTFPSGSKAVLHLVPHGFIEGVESFSTEALLAEYSNLSPLTRDGLSKRLNLDGLVIFSPSTGNETLSYIQLFRHGVIEAVDAPLASDNSISPGLFEHTIIERAKSYLEALERNGVRPPIYLFAGFLNIAGANLELPQDAYWLTPKTFKKSNLLLPEVVVEGYGNELSALLKPAFDRLWNAFDLEKSFYYNDDGERQRPRW